MSDAMNLRWSILGRPLKPVALGLALLMGILAVWNMTGGDSLGETIWSHLVIPVAAAACAMFIGAWWTGSQRVLEWALLVTVGVSVARAAFIPLALGWRGFGEIDMVQSIAVAVIAAGSYLLEADDSRSRQGVKA